ncbi:hypothetical protein F5J12DRAFT_782335 [Pisolithus orientalis]|uniref:uncharacterized protein n=1 Tax=Pisolithus orientalis TaxID=936130 RepID=UPI0022247DA0|nr:uncharacterized protein F5J12DRAFT_782335 [Pisolithus orientalis]KAI6008932.1 hypothetical protein F5J12DRAFT_782335 [Pisolithus orientalis]
MAGATDMKLWDVVEDSKAIREQEGKCQLDHPILRYMLTHLKTLQTQKQEYLNNKQAELGEQGYPRNESVRGVCGSKSERHSADMHEPSPGSHHLVVRVCKKVRDMSEKPLRYSPKITGVTPGK